MVDGKKKNKKSQYHQKPTARTNANQDQVSDGAIDTNNGRSGNRSAASLLDGRDLIYVSPTRVCSSIFARRRHDDVLDSAR